MLLERCLGFGLQALRVLGWRLFSAKGGGCQDFGFRPPRTTLRRIPTMYVFLRVYIYIDGHQGCISVGIVVAVNQGCRKGGDADRYVGHSDAVAMPGIYREATGSEPSQDSSPKALIEWPFAVAFPLSTLPTVGP